MGQIETLKEILIKIIREKSKIKISIVIETFTFYNTNHNACTIIINNVDYNKTLNIIFFFV